MDQGFKIFRRDSSSNDGKKTATVEIDDLDKKVEKLFSGQDLLFERLHTEPKWQRTKTAYHAGVKVAKTSARYVHKQPHLIKVVSVVIVSLLVGGMFQLSRNSSNGQVNEVAGVADVESTEGQGGSIGSLPRETPEFDLLIPAGKEFSRLDIVKVSPAGNDAVYAYIDTLEKIDITISQQKVPKSFDYNEQAELERVAKDFQATNVIQIDDSKVFHGMSDKTKQQSLLFIKNDLLIFIKSPEKLSDDVWASYILGMSKN